MRLLRSHLPRSFSRSSYKQRAEVAEAEKQAEAEKAAKLQVEPDAAKLQESEKEAAVSASTLLIPVIRNPLEIEMTENQQPQSDEQFGL